MRNAVIVAAAALAFAACGGGGESSDGSGPETAATTVDSATPSTDPAPPTTTSDTGSDAAADASTTTSTSTTIAVAADPLIAGIEPSIELLTPPSGNGPRPLLEWAAVDGASAYLVTVHAPDGQPYWTWTGPSTSVHVGGEPVLDDAVPGPSVIDGMSWGVVALNDDYVPVAISVSAPIAP